MLWKNSKMTWCFYLPSMHAPRNSNGNTCFFWVAFFFSSYPPCFSQAYRQRNWRRIYRKVIIEYSRGGKCCRISLFPLINLLALKDVASKMNLTQLWFARTYSISAISVTIWSRWLTCGSASPAFWAVACFARFRFGPADWFDCVLFVFPMMIGEYVDKIFGEYVAKSLSSELFGARAFVWRWNDGKNFPREVTGRKVSVNWLVGCH